ncbi:hypothetical protein AOQ84DRAFT_229436 [Glonium stellatum]|uniref:Uncharacterized protein n=1 Tax=Glonium stellatum TaxID=574774 RepID=A0A8E2JMJ2_9PEZI|nr:hypothetical protein AOQ84DRAFT_229436 [Glonium stellatum]
MSITFPPHPKGFKLSRSLTQRSDPQDLLSDIEFTPDKDSDELFECLKRSFPTGKTHMERMKMARMEFIVSEQEEKSPRPLKAQPPKRALAASSAPSDSDTKPRKSLQAIENTHQPRRPQSVLRQEAPPNATNATNPIDAIAPKPDQPANATYLPEKLASTAMSLNEMTSVWRASDGAWLHSRRKKPMTIQQRIEYNITRVKGACVICKKKKRKCKHRLPQGNGLPDSQPLEECLEDTHVEMSNVQHDRSVNIAGHDQQLEPTMRNGLIPSFRGSQKGGPPETLTGLLDPKESQNPQLGSVDSGSLPWSGLYQHAQGHYKLNALSSAEQNSYITNPQHTLHEKEDATFYDKHSGRLSNEITFDEFYPEVLESQPLNNTQSPLSTLIEHDRRKLDTPTLQTTTTEPWANTRSTIDPSLLDTPSAARHSYSFNEETDNLDNPGFASIPATEQNDISQSDPSAQIKSIELPKERNRPTELPPEADDTNWLALIDWNSETDSESPTCDETEASGTNSSSQTPLSVPQSSSETLYSYSSGGGSWGRSSGTRRTKCVRAEELIYREVPLSRNDSKIIYEKSRGDATVSKHRSKSNLWIPDAPCRAARHTTRHAVLDLADSMRGLRLGPQYN